MHVLVVDDSATMRRIIKKALMFGGLDASDLSEAGNGKEALAVYEEKMPNLVISDVNMPEMGGVELLQALRERGFLPRSPVVMVTSTVGAKQALELVREGASRVIRKPFDPHGLARELEGFLQAPAEPEPEPAPESPEEAGTGGAAEEPDDGRCEACEEVEAALSEGLARVLELMAFSGIDRVDEPLPGNRILFFSSIRFHTPPLHELFIYCAPEVAFELAENILGESPSDDDAARLDAVGELLNVLAGELLDILLRDSGGVRAATFDVPRSGVAIPGQIPDSPGVAYALDDGESLIFMRYTLAKAEEAAA